MRHVTVFKIIYTPWTSIWVDPIYTKLVITVFDVSYFFGQGRSLKSKTILQKWDTTLIVYV